jgi:isochorismate hydrolase
LKPTESDYIIPKQTYSAFDGTRLEKALKGMYNGKGEDTIISTGMHTGICERDRGYDAFLKDLDIIVPEDGTDTFTENDYVLLLNCMKWIKGA